jgi:hypothetical protein
MLKSLWALLFLLLGTAISAQLPVRNEPRHHNIFENDFVRILDVHIPPGDTTQYHLHHTPSVFTTFTKTRTASQLKDQPSLPGSYSVAGEIWYYSLVTPRLHRVWNEDSTWFHVMDVELVAAKPLIKPTVLTATSLKLLYNESLANIYKLQLKKGETISLPVLSTGYILISLGNARVDLFTNKLVEHRVLQAGNFAWIAAGNSVIIKLVDDGKSGFSLIQLK